ncbi:MAG: glycosyltransferase [Gemmatimonadetes bacterium]|nr:glycosyltransferase [Gemmatimonadota bacterium]
MVIVDPRLVFRVPELGIHGRQLGGERSDGVLHAFPQVMRGRKGGICPEPEGASSGAVSIAVILSTYNQPHYLRLVLDGYACQTRRPDRILIADDGSTPPTAQALDQAARATGLSLIHVWHPDRGFRKTAILNRVLEVAGEDVLVFSDGDCIPRRDFVEGHLRLTQEGRFVSGGYLRLPAETSVQVTAEGVRDGSVFRSGWLRERGWNPGRRALRLLPWEAPARILDWLTPTKATWNGHNASALRRHLLDANGFDMDMAYGGEDRALGERLANAGVRGVQARHRLPVVHLEHDRPYADPAAIARNREIRTRIGRERGTRALQGLAELRPDPELVVRTVSGKR